MISAEVKVPSAGSLNAGPVKVHTYTLNILALHAVHRLLVAEQVLLSRNHHVPRSRTQQARRRQVARKAWAQAMLELVLHYDLHLAARKATEDEPDEGVDRSLRDSRLFRAASLGHFGVEAYYFDSTLFLGLHHFLERHTAPDQVVQELLSFIQTVCKIGRSPHCDQANLLQAIEGLTRGMLQFLKDRVRTGPLP